MNNKLSYVYLLIIALPLFYGCGNKIVYFVMDEKGNPIPGAIVTTSYFTGGGLGNASTKDYHDEGLTDGEGFYIYNKSMAGPANMRASARKEGYYKSYAFPEVYFWEIGKRWKDKTAPKVIGLKQRIKPIKMYAKHVNLRLPKTEGIVGYDLVAGDFLPPYGIGEKTDLIFHVSSKAGHRLQDITFSNDDDGIQPFLIDSRFGLSSLSAGHTAPLTGYLSSWKKADDLGYQQFINITKKQADDRMRDTTQYYFRVRTQKDGSAMYGFCIMKFWGIPFISFEYYLNPDGTTNIEYGESYFKMPAKDETSWPPKVPN